MLALAKSKRIFHRKHEVKEPIELLTLYTFILVKDIFLFILAHAREVGS